MQAVATKTITTKAMVGDQIVINTTDFDIGEGDQMITVTITAQPVEEIEENLEDYEMYFGPEGIEAGELLAQMKKLDND